MPITRRARDANGRVIAPMTLGWCREHGIERVEATCEACRHSATLDVTNWPAATYVPDVGLRLRCSACGGREIETRPDWSQYVASGKPGGRRC